jgi:hypothetical protein
MGRDNTGESPVCQNRKSVFVAADKPGKMGDPNWRMANEQAPITKQAPMTNDQ